MNSKEFARQFLLGEVEKMKAADVRLHLLSAMVHGTETAGALLDPLPFKAKGQGKKRFSIALKVLFPSEYAKAAVKIDLYGQLRSHMAHCLLPAQNIIVHTDKPDKHLQFEGKLIHLSLDAFYNDYCRAMQKLIGEIESGNLKNKKIGFENLDFSLS